MTQRAQSLGALDKDLYAHKAIRNEIRDNLIVALRDGRTLFPGIIGYDTTVIPQLINALLARHDIVLLGLRGQAKTRLCRELVSMLDEYTPIIAGSALREHPLFPVTQASKLLCAQAGDDLAIEWLHRDQRYAEKLATPDVTVADLIGDIDPLKAAHEKLNLSDERIIHYGIIPRSNRGIFTINEVPDLAPRIQVGLLNVLEEQDIQIRGFPLRLPLDVLMLFTANPEDYTNRGSIITPLKDRIASQITTHYPNNLTDARAISGDQSWVQRGDQLPTVSLPDFFEDILEEIAFCGRDSEFIDQKSGVSARLSIAARELLVSQVERRVIVNTDDAPVPRIIDLFQLVPAITGKVELVYEGEQEGVHRVARHLIGEACRKVFDSLFPSALNVDGTEVEGAKDDSDIYRPILEWVSQGNNIDIADDESTASYQKTLDAVPRLRAVAQNAGSWQGDELYLAMELVLEALHQHALISKADVDNGSRYGDMLRSMMEDSRS